MGEVCVKCGVVVGSAGVLRRKRWGHIELGLSVAHPLVVGGTIECVPVLPLWYRRPEVYGSDLDCLYSDLLRATEAPIGTAAKGIELAVARLFCNEWLEQPLTHEGRKIRSVAHYLLEDPAATIDTVGVYLRALCLRLAVQKVVYGP